MNLVIPVFLMCMDNDMKYEQLLQLCTRNGRIISLMKDGRIFTCDNYEYTDGQYFETIEEAIEWEKGYIPDEILVQSL